MSDPATTALTSALDNSAKVANTPLFATVIDRILGFKISEWNAQGETIKKQILDGYEEAKQKGLGIQYVSAFRSNANLINTSIKAAKYIISEAKGVIEIDNDVFWGLLEHSKLISSEEMQELIAKILAGEYNAPGTYSMSTLQILKSLGKDELENFSLLGDVYLPGHGFFRDFFGLNTEAVAARTKINLDYTNFLEMQNLGLIQSGAYTISIPVKKDEMFKMEYGDGVIIVKALEDKANWDFPECYQLTNAGKQIRQHLAKRESAVFREWLKNYLKKEGLEVLT
ncbi:MAG: DUF2806 domain-containing protein [Patescibacteria group bacterium]